jgi:hypothetical protein
MGAQLRLLDEEHREQCAAIWSSLPESARRDVRERFAALLVAVVRSSRRKERSDDVDEDRAEASGS